MGVHCSIPYHHVLTDQHKRKNAKAERVSLGMGVVMGEVRWACGWCQECTASHHPSGRTGVHTPLSKLCSGLRWGVGVVGAGG
eukprot:2933764-Amphidinium_carterae.1